MTQDQRLRAFIVRSPEDIAALAYEMDLNSGKSDGFDRDDWFRAKLELNARGRDAERRGDAP